MTFIKKGSLITLAWPETKVIKEGKWYDAFCQFFGILKDNYYKAGHAACILIEYKTGKCFYFDFGRYHTPLKYGRVRDLQTDPELLISTQAIINKDKIANLTEILIEVSNNKSTHGSGKMYASEYADLNFNMVFKKAKLIQSKGAVYYGPLAIKGTNCSRFVTSVAKAGNISKLLRILLAVPYTISPSPRFNVRFINNKGIYYSVISGHVIRTRNNFFSLFYLYKKPIFK